MKKALITGINGQDGSFMRELLQNNGYTVYGCTRTDDPVYLINYLRPNEVYNFASVSNVFDPWKNLDTILDLNGKLPQRILECIVKTDKSIKFFQASSCLIFGRNEEGYQDEDTPADPIHPYGIAKLYADNMVKEFRKVHNIFACSGIFFSHESERRGADFFTKKITTAAVNIKAGKQQKVKIGNIHAIRDYGYAKDYMKAAYLMMQNAVPTDYVIGTSNLTSISEFIEKCFVYLNLNYLDHIEVDQSICRNNDNNTLRANISKIKRELGWHPETTVDQMIKIMINHASTI